MALLGPTAAGKSRLAMQIAEHTEAEILSVDSMQVYRGMDIGTAKPTPADQARVRHHMIDIVEPDQPYTVADFRRDARGVLDRTTAPLVLIVGGSGLHFRAVVDPMRFRATDPALRADLERRDRNALTRELVSADSRAGEHIDLSNPRRVIRAVEALRLEGMTPSRLATLPERTAYQRYQSEIDFVGIGIDRSDLEPSVEARLRAMRHSGLLEEVEGLKNRLGPTAAQAVGYRQLLPVVEGRIDPESGWENVRLATMRLAKRQRTFFRRDPRLKWFDAGREDLFEAVAQELGL